MGYLGYRNKVDGDERLVIASRFSGENNDFLFLYLLEKVLDLPNIIDMMTDADYDSGLFNFLAFLFPYYLKNALRKGVFKKYIRREYNDRNIKGTIDIARFIKKDTPFVGNIAYSQREFSCDNSLMELVRHTIEYIKGKHYGHILLSRVKDEVKLVVEATPGYAACRRQKVIEENQKNKVRHAYYREYFALQQLCILILRGQNHRIGFGTKHVYGILFDGSWLWEEYVSSLIKDTFYRTKNKAKKGERNAQQLFTKSDNGKTGRIYPDFISQDSKNRIIADAKYKPIENIGAKVSGDYFQILTYMFRFDAKQGYFLYPEAKGEDVKDGEKLRLNSGSTFEKNVAPRDDIIVIKHGLKIPKVPADATYEDFKSQMKAAEQEFKKKFSQYVDNAAVTADSR